MTDGSYSTSPLSEAVSDGRNEERFCAEQDALITAKLIAKNNRKP
jgi:hypothetical protein